MRLRDAALSACAWSFYLYLVRGSALTLAAAVGLDVLLGLPPLPPAPMHGDIIATLLSYAAVIAHNAMLLMVWSLYNFVRFRGHNRRLFAKVVSAEDLAELYRLPAEDVTAWQHARRIVMHHDAAGNVLGSGAADGAAAAAGPGHRSP